MGGLGTISALLFAPLALALVTPCLAASRETPALSAARKSLEAQGLEGCGVNCKYEKANENLSLEAFYINEKLTRLEKVAKNLRSELDKPQEDQDPSVITRLGSELTSNMEGYCANDAALKCYERHGASQALRLREIRGAMIGNNQMLQGLSSDGAQTVQYMRETNAKDPATLLPLLPKAAEFKAMNQERVKSLQEQRVLTSIDYEKWVMDFPKAPDPSAFVKVKPIPRDPKDPSAGTLEVPEVDGNGKLQIDKGAYDAAMLKHNKRLELAKRDQEELLEKYGKGAKTNLGSVQTLEHDITAEAYLETRNQFVAAYNQDQTAKKKDKKTSGREPATPAETASSYSSKSSSVAVKDQKVASIKELELQPGKARPNVNLKWSMEAMTTRIQYWEKAFVITPVVGTP